MFSEYPYVDFQNLNLDWLMKRIRETDEKLEENLKRSTITFHDPITWDITDQYTVNTMVIDSDGTAYLSVKAVPAGIDISDTDYWQPIFNYDDNINGIRATIGANERNRGTASDARAAGDLVYLNGKLYKVTVDMEPGAAYIIGTNCVEYTVSNRIRDLLASIGTNAQAISTEVANREQAINAEAEARTNAVNDINEKLEQEPQTFSRLFDKISFGNNTIMVDRMAKLLDGYVTPEQFGAKGDGQNDDTEAIIEALNCTDSDTVYFNGKYHTTRSIPLPHSKHLVGGGGISNGLFLDAFVTGTFDISNSYDVYFDGLTMQSLDIAPSTASKYFIYGNNTERFGGVNITTCWLVGGNSTQNNVKFLHMEGNWHIVHAYNVLLDAGVKNGAPIELISSDYTHVSDVNLTNIFADCLFSSNADCANILVKDVSEVELMNCTFRVNSTPYNVKMESTTRVTVVNADSCVFLNEGPDIGKGAISVPIGCIYRDTGCDYRNVSIINRSFIAKTYGHRVYQLTDFEDGRVAILNPDQCGTSHEYDGSFSLFASSRADQKLVGASFSNTAGNEFNFKIDGYYGSGHNICVGVGIISTGVRVARIMAYDPSIGAYAYREVGDLNSFSAGDPPTLKTKAIKEIKDPMFKFIYNKANATYSLLISDDDGYAWYGLLENETYAAYDRVGVVILNRQEDAPVAFVNVSVFDAH